MITPKGLYEVATTFPNRIGRLKEEDLSPIPMTVLGPFVVAATALHIAPGLHSLASSTTRAAAPFGCSQAGAWRTAALQMLEMTEEKMSTLDGSVVPAQQEAGAEPLSETGRRAVGSSACGAINGKLHNSRSTKGVLNIVEKNYETLNAVNLATALHRLAIINKKNRAGRDAMLRDPRFEKLLTALFEHSGELTARSVADMLWSLATLQHWPAWMLVPVLTAVNVELDKGTFEAQHLATLVWALAKLETKPVRLLEKIEAQVAPRLGELDMQNHGNLLWGCATLKYEPTKVLPELTQALQPEMLLAAQPVEISNVAYAMGELTRPHEYDDMLLALARVAAPDAVLPRFSSRQIVTMLTAYSKLDAASSLPDGILDAWVKAVRDAHETRPLMARDARAL